MSVCLLFNPCPPSLIAWQGMKDRMDNERRDLAPLVAQQQPPDLDAGATYRLVPRVCAPAALRAALCYAAGPAVGCKLTNTAGSGPSALSLSLYARCPGQPPMFAAALGCHPPQVPNQRALLLPLPAPQAFMDQWRAYMQQAGKRTLGSTTKADQVGVALVHHGWGCAIPSSHGQQASWCASLACAAQLLRTELSAEGGSQPKEALSRRRLTSLLHPPLCRLCGRRAWRRPCWVCCASATAPPPLAATSRWRRVPAASICLPTRRLRCSTGAAGAVWRGW